MSAISGYINQIQNAVYGEQVRSSIVNALLACYSDVNSPSLQTAAFSAALNEAYAGGILDIQTVTSFNAMTNDKIIYRYNGTAAGKQKGLYYYSALSNSWVLIGSEIQKVSLLSQMTDVNDIYKYIGTESGMVQNSLYCHNGTAWVPIGSGVLTASTAAQMTNQDAIYKYTGNETGYTTNALYYYNGTAWVPISDGVTCDSTLTQSGVPADAKATGDAIVGATEDIYDTLGYTGTTKINPSGSLMCGLSTTGEITSSTKTRSFYFECEPNTTYKLITSSEATTAPGAAHYIAEFSELPAVGSQSSNFVYRTDLPGTLELTTSADASYVLFGHGLWTSNEWLSVYDDTPAGKTFGERLDDIEEELGAVIDFSDSEAKTAFVSLMNTKASELGMNDSTFASPSGLTSANTSSPRDLFKLGVAVAANPEAAKMMTIPEKDYTIQGNLRTITVSNAGYNLLSTDFVPYYTVLGNKTGSLGGAPWRSAIIITTIEGKTVLLTIMVSGSTSFDNIWTCAKEVADMVKTQLQGGTPTEGTTLSGMTGGYVAGVIPQDPAFYSEMVNAQFVSNLDGIIKRNPDTSLKPASCSKVLTMLCALDHVKDLKGTTVTVKTADIETGSGSTYQNGDKLTLYDALCIMITESSNTLAQAIGRTVGNIYLTNQYRLSN